MIAILLAAALGSNGPISKFEGKAPEADYLSRATLGDIERCLIDMDGHPAPNVYRQADRPGRVTFIWVVDARARDRLDLEQRPDGVHVRSWIGSQQAKACAPS
ncbi:hypothetical protein [Sphingomonas carotinifaciens]|uniref:hypothetical protein n=1 Tax=Sphingomonas carotinifaciens TaxID=1166323 RepID=UPI0012378814|nr:hypothetical protein [Sphingomonas carotinifaciens]